MIAASSRAEFSLKRLSFFPEPALTACNVRKGQVGIERGEVGFSRLCDKAFSCGRRLPGR
jgi:hypothetical protein